MDITLKATVLYSAIILTGLSAGLFFAWQVSVIPGTKKAQDLVYIEVMQKINRAIINPPFMLIFLGPVLLQLLGVFLFRDTSLTFWVLLAAFIAYGSGTVLVTGFGNVPLNDELDTLRVHELSEKQLIFERRGYENPWNRLHLIRTIFAVISFMLLLFVSFITS